MANTVFILLLCGLTCGLASYNFIDCSPTYRKPGILRKCCPDVQLPNGCECYDVSGKTDFINSLYHKPLCPIGARVRFLLFTRTNNNDAHVIRVGDNSILTSSFQGRRPTKFIIHGFTDFSPCEWTADMTGAILNLEDMNVIHVDWRKAAQGPNYLQAVANTRMVGAMLARLIQEMVDRHGARLQDFHLIGHSLGAHVCGIAGKEISRLTSGLLGRITGLDPAGFCFDNHSPNVRLDKSDATFVDIIHTDAEPILNPGLGTRLSLGHVDFYPNGGQHQPSCPKESGGLLSFFDFQEYHSSFISAAVCSHSRALNYFTDSISSCPRSTTNTVAARRGLGPIACDMGYHTNPLCRGDVYLVTTNQSPFCKINNIL